MGADFMLAVQEVSVPKETVLDNVKKLTLTPVDLETFEDSGISDFYDTEFDEEVAESMKERLMEAVEAVYSLQGTSTYFYVDNRLFHATGGTSWGEEPSDCYFDFCLVNSYEELLMPKQTS